MTEGEYRVGITFNPSSDGLVDRIKQDTAALIDLINESNGENRTKANAMDAFEVAAMWAVKSVTKPPRDFGVIIEPSDQPNDEPGDEPTPDPDGESDQ